MPSYWDYPIQVEVDIEEPRVALDRLVVTAGGRPERQAWDIDISSGVWRDPLRGRVMLAPLPVTADWRTTTTGNYARLAKADYTLTTASAWVDNHRGVSGNVYLEGNGTNERVTTTTSYSADQPMYVSIYVPSGESLGEQTILECGWGTYGDASSVFLRFRANGSVAIYKGSTQIGYQDLDYAATSTKSGGLTKSVGQATVNILLLPIRLRDTSGNSRGGELLIVTDALAAHVQGFPDIGSGDAIVPAGPFYWTVPFGRPSVQVAPVKFATSGTLYGPAQTLRYAPDSPRSFTGRGFYSTIGASPTATYEIVTTAGSAYTPDGTTTGVRGKVSLSGDGTNSICVEAVDWTMARTDTLTDDSEKCDITDAIQDIEINLDDFGVATCRIIARRGALATAGVQGYIHLSDRPFRVYAINPGDSSEVTLLRGVLNSPTWTPSEGTGAGDADLIEWHGEDRSAEFRYYQIGDAVADDDKLFTDAIEDAVTIPGFDSGTLLLSTSTYRVPYGDPPQGEWAMIPQRGETVQEHLNRLFDTYAANWWRGWVPTLTGYKYRAQAKADLSSSPVVTLYDNETDAIAAGLSASEAVHRTIRRCVRNAGAPEANQVVVIGFNRYTGRLIISQDNDTAAQTPATAPSSRPVQWRGRVHRVMEIDPTIGTQTQADNIRTALYDRVAAERFLLDWTSDFLFVASSGRPLWTGDVVRIYAPGRATYEDWRIVGMPSIRLPRMCTLTQYNAGIRPFYEADYRGERIAEGP